MPSLITTAMGLRHGVQAARSVRHAANEARPVIRHMAARGHAKAVGGAFSAKHVRDELGKFAHK